jgi:hypothetical protein
MGIRVVTWGDKTYVNWLKIGLEMEALTQEQQVRGPCKALRQKVGLIYDET